MDRKVTQPRRLSGSFEYLFGISLVNSACSPWSCTGLMCLTLYVYRDIVLMIPCMIVFGVNRDRCPVHTSIASRHRKHCISGCISSCVPWLPLWAVAYSCGCIDHVRSHVPNVTWYVSRPSRGTDDPGLAFRLGRVAITECGSSLARSTVKYQTRWDFKVMPSPPSQLIDLIQDTFQSQNFSRAESHMPSVVKQPAISL